MNILIAANYATPQSGNFIGSMYELGEEVRKHGHELFFVFPKHPNTLKENSWVDWLRRTGFTVLLIEKEKPDHELLSELEDIINKYHIDILHTHFNMYNRAIALSKRKLPVKILFHDHFGIPWEHNTLKARIRNIVFSLIYRLKGISLIFVSQHLAAGFPFAKRWHVPNAASMKRNIDRSRTREECRAALGIDENEKLCLMLGWSLQVKGLDIALKALDICHKQDPSIVLGIVGFGDKANEKAVNFIQQSTHVDPHADWIHYLPDTEDMYAYHRAADVYLSSSRTEGFSYGLLEAIIQDTPAVVSDIIGTKWAEMYNHAYFYPVEDAGACADAICKALTAGRENSNSQQVADRFHIQRWCQQIMDIYQQVGKG